MLKDSEIAEAVHALEDERLLLCGIRDNDIHLQLYSSGLFSVLFKICCAGENWAFKCWRFLFDNCSNRYRLIESCLEHVSLPYFSSFEYHSEGLRINGDSYPILWMKWVKGQPLKSFLLKNYKETETLEALAANFKEMCLQLNKSKIAHGDMQSDNILIDENQQLHLLDYDAVYVPEMEESFSDFMNGRVDFQHPARKNNRGLFEGIDYFSVLVIYISLLTALYKPSLVEKYIKKDDASPALFFQAKDYSCVERSAIYQDINLIGSPILYRYLDLLSTYLSIGDIRLLPPPFNNE